MVYAGPVVESGGWSVLAAVAVGSSVGGVARHLVTETVVRWTGGVFPWGTVFANVSGSLVIGVLAGASLSASPPVWRHGIVTGVLGGYTTFSAFSVQTLTLLQQGQVLAAAANVTLSVALGLAACWAGFALTAGLSR